MWGYPYLWKPPPTSHTGRSNLFLKPLRPQHSVFKGRSRSLKRTVFKTPKTSGGTRATPCRASTSHSGYNILSLKPLRPQHTVFKRRSSVQFARLQNPQNISLRHSGHSLPFARPLLTLRGNFGVSGVAICTYSIWFLA